MINTRCPGLDRFQQDVFRRGHVGQFGGEARDHRTRTRRQQGHVERLRLKQLARDGHAAADIHAERVQLMAEVAHKLHQAVLERGPRRGVEEAADVFAALEQRHAVPALRGGQRRLQSQPVQRRPRRP